MWSKTHLALSLGGKPSILLQANLLPLRGTQLLYKGLISILKAFLPISPDVGHPPSKNKLCKDLAYSWVSLQATPDPAEAQPIVPAPWANLPGTQITAEQVLQDRERMHVTTTVWDVFFLIFYKMKSFWLQALYSCHIWNRFCHFCVQRLPLQKET